MQQRVDDDDFVAHGIGSDWIDIGSAGDVEEHVDSEDACLVMTDDGSPEVVQLARTFIARHCCTPPVLLPRCMFDV